MAGILTAAVASTFGANADPYFEYTTLLLPGNGTNGAQNNTFLDGSTNNFTITRNGNTTQGTFSPFSQTGWGNYFDGSGDYLSVPDNAAFTLGSGDFTVEVWVYKTTTGTQRFISAQSGSSGANTSISYSLQVNASEKIVGSIFSGATNYAATSSGDCPLNAWTHIVLARDGNTLRLYINGVQDGTASVTGVTVNDSSDILGIGSLGAYTSLYWPGYLSNFRLVKGTCVYPNGTTFTPPTAPLTAISGTSLLTCQSNRFIDNSTNNFTITRNGDTRVVAFSPFNPTASWSAATYGGSGYFDGSGDYLSVARNNAFLSTGDFTYETWVYPTATPDANGAWLGGLGEVGDGTNFSWVLKILNDFTIDFYIRSSNVDRITTAKVVPFQWNYVVVTRQGSGSNNLLISVNGTNQTYTDTGSLVGNGTPQFTIGADQNGDESLFTGYISNARFLNGTGYTSVTIPTAPLTAITNTSLLLNFTNAGIYDATSKNDLETVGDAQISNAVTPKWGSTSIKFDGTGDWLDALASNQLFNLSSGDWTIEAWIYRNASGATHTILNLFNASANNSGLTFYVNASNQLVTDNGTVAALAAGTVASGQWVHVAIVRSGSTTTGYVNGTSVGTTTQAPAASQYARIGALASGFNLFNGYIQDLRITKGYARYTANFTTPTAAFPTL